MTNLDEALKWRYSIKKHKCELCDWLGNGDPSEKLCFIFVADCNGDTTYICLKHMKEIIHKMEEVKT